MTPDFPTTTPHTTGEIIVDPCSPTRGNELTYKTKVLRLLTMYSATVRNRQDV